VTSWFVYSKAVVYPAIVTEAEFVRVFELRRAKRTLTAGKTFSVYEWQIREVIDL
jgi:hypothetical protein